MLAMALRAFLLVVYLFTPAEGLDELLGRDLGTTAPSAPDAIPTDFAFARPEDLKVFRLYRLVGSELNCTLLPPCLLLWRNALFPSRTPRCPPRREPPLSSKALFPH